MRSSKAVVGIVSCIVVACAQDRQLCPMSTAADLEPLAQSGSLPYSLNDTFAILDDSTACIVDSYEVRILCGDRNWGRVTALGREGKGPGELSPNGYLVSGPADSVSYVDPGNSRLTVFTPGSAGRSFEWPALVGPAGEWDRSGRLAAYAFPSTPSGTPELRVVTLDLEGKVLAENKLRFDPGTLDVVKAILTGATQSPNGGWAVRAEADQRQALAQYSSKGGFLGLLEWPPLAASHPTARDMDTYVEQYERVFRRSPTDAQLREFRDRPLGRLPRSTVRRTVQIDGEDRVWVLTTARTDTTTCVDLFAGLEYTGAVEFAGRVLGIQILDSLLLTLAEDRPGDSSDVPERHLAWYRIR